MIPFQFSQDSFLGKLILEAWIQTGGNEKELIDALNSNLEEGQAFYITPNAEKQVLLNLLPAGFRKDIEHSDYVLVGEKIQDLVKGNSHITPTPKLDVALDIIEWVLTGFDLTEVVQDLLNIVFNKKLKITEDLIVKIRSLYLEHLNKPNNFDF